MALVPTTAIYVQQVLFPNELRRQGKTFQDDKPGDADFMKQLADRSQNVDSEVLGVWDVQK